MTKRPKGAHGGGGENDESLSFGSALDELGFKSVGRRNVRRAQDVDRFVRKPHPFPRNACFDRRSGMIVVEFVNDAVFTIPAKALRGLSDATGSQIADVGLLGGTHLHWKLLGLSYEIAELMSGKLSSPTETGVSGKDAPEVSGDQEPSVPGWVAPVIELLADNLPGDRRSRWYHDFLTAYQIACETLVALGQAEQTSDGAVPRPDPILPPISPRWDDVAVAVIFLAAQNGMITFLPDSAREPAHSAGKGYDRVHKPGGRKWAALVHPQVSTIFRLLGMLEDREWTEAAETVLWRDSPIEWHVDFTGDPRFLRAVDDACYGMPDSIREKIDRFSQITDEDIALFTSESSQQDDGKPILRLPPQTREQAVSTILWIRRFDFDELFYKFWRINDGWLSQDEARQALEIFNDALAVAVRKRVAARLYPHIPHLAD